jgi:hypothetical protein
MKLRCLPSAYALVLSIGSAAPAFADAADDSPSLASADSVQAAKKPEAAYAKAE